MSVRTSPVAGGSPPREAAPAAVPRWLGWYLVVVGAGVALLWVAWLPLANGMLLYSAVNSSGWLWHNQPAVGGPHRRHPGGLGGLDVGAAGVAAPAPRRTAVTGYVSGRTWWLAAVCGALAGVGGFIHGIGEILQGSVPPAGSVRR